MNQKLMSELSKWLKHYRKESGLTLLQLKAAIGDLCSDAYLSKIENNRYKGKKGNPPRVDIEIVDALAVALNRPVDEARNAAGYSAKNTILPDELRGIDFTKFTSEQLTRIKNFIVFTAVETKQEIERSLGFNVKDFPAKQPNGVSGIEAKPLLKKDSENLVFEDKGEIKTGTISPKKRKAK
jgi:transcriptional regulator with XRE-family HTH domain